MVEATRSGTLVGQMVGNYRVDRLIGVGGMGEVYLLHHVQLPNTLAGHGGPRLRRPGAR